MSRNVLPRRASLSCLKSTLCAKPSDFWRLIGTSTVEGKGVSSFLPLDALDLDLPQVFGF